MRSLITMVMFGYLGLGFPDTDLILLPILHHRSIVTHSIIIPALVLLRRNQAVRFGAAGFILGESVHLAADVLSFPRGFAMVWLPWPIKFPLGFFSPLWLAANALVGLVLSKLFVLKQNSNKPLAMYVGMAIFLGFSCAVIHERSLVPFASFLCIFVLSFMIAGWIRDQQWFDWLAQPALSRPSPRPSGA